MNYSYYALLVKPCAEKNPWVENLPNRPLIKLVGRIVGLLGFDSNYQAEALNLTASKLLSYPTA